MSIQTFSRYEKKYLITGSQKEELLKRINMNLNYDAYSQNGKYYKIFNIYYDTVENSLISESIKKPIYKEKLRLRSYKEISQDTDLVYLEIKKKSEGKVNKRRIPLTYKDSIELITSNKEPIYDEKDFLNNQVLKEIKYLLYRYKLRPNYYIAYHRVAYFCKEDPSIRITFDDNIIQRIDNIDFKNDNGSRILPNGIYLMEIKVGKAFPLWLANALSDLNIFPRSFSKYGTAYQINTKKEGDNICAQ